MTLSGKSTVILGENKAVFAKRVTNVDMEYIAP